MRPWGFTVYEMPKTTLIDLAKLHTLDTSATLELTTTFQSRS